MVSVGFAEAPRSRPEEGGLCGDDGVSETPSCWAMALFDVPLWASSMTGSAARHAVSSSRPGPNPQLADLVFL